MKEYFALMGLKVRDRVTGMTGVVTSISFDLYGCVQCIVTGEIKEGATEAKNSYWFDHKRLETLDSDPVMPVPDWFASAPGVENGPEAKPEFDRLEAL